ncbi:ubiquitin-related domain-containing protein [Rhexocercosporidium sp. MPI-PUGE-AT-0058]|nr:ubiquitin-related domain-containing protein [Rhexocercosporidium sp. MPI-PUGE-AT-0058]
METSGAGHAHASQPLSSSTTAQPSSHIPVEMSDIDTSKRSVAGTGAADTGAGAGSQGLLNDVSIPSSSPIDTSFPTTSSMAQSAPADENSKPGPVVETSQSTTSPLPTVAKQQPTMEAGESSTAPAIQRLDSVAIGPSSDSSPPPAAVEAGPVLVITLLLGTGARHPYRIDEKYLTKRNVTVPGMTEGGRKDPFSISVYTLKELILREWREEWEAQPSSPSSIRLIYFGRLLDDKTPLRDCKFNSESANVVHMTVRPQDIVDEEDASKSKALARDREGGESTAGCRCVIQ